MNPPILFGVTIQLVLSVLRNPRNPLSSVIDYWRGALTDPYMAAARIAPILMMPFFFASFSVLKMLMPRYVPFWRTYHLLRWTVCCFSDISHGN